MNTYIFIQDCGPAGAGNFTKADDDGWWDDDDDYWTFNDGNFLGKYIYIYILLLYFILSKFYIFIIFKYT